MFHLAFLYQNMLQCFVRLLFCFSLCLDGSC